MFFILRAALPLLMGRIVAFAGAQERQILERGLPLDATSLADAHRVGVEQPKKVRVLEVDEIPVPAQRLLRAIGRQMGLVSAQTRGMSFRYGIYVRRGLAKDRALIAHELVHTCQYERLGSMSAFLTAYLEECLTIGYPNGPLEQEAVLGAVGAGIGNQ